MTITGQQQQAQTGDLVAWTDMLLYAGFPLSPSQRGQSIGQQLKYYRAATIGDLVVWTDMLLYAGFPAEYYRAATTGVMYLPPF